LRRRLRADGLRPWLDEEDLEPGQKWEPAIRRAIKSSRIVLACLSETSVTKVGYVQKEIKFALDTADEQPDDSIYLIPVRLELCDIPERLAHLHASNLFAEGGYQRLLAALRRAISAPPGPDPDFW
jgi:hypothetical protein